MEEKTKILYVDDEEINLLLFEIQFRIHYNVLTALDAHIGLDLLSENSDIEVVLSDIKMPQMDGIEFIKKAREKYPHISFFIVTGYEITREMQGLINAGVVQKYFCKPFDISGIHDSIIEILSKKQ